MRWTFSIALLSQKCTIKHATARCSMIIFSGNLTIVSLFANLPKVIDKQKHQLPGFSEFTECEFREVKCIGQSVSQIWKLRNDRAGFLIDLKDLQHTALVS